MSFRVKGPKVQPTPPVPAQEVAPISSPVSGRAKRLATGGRQSTFLGGLASASLPAPRNTLTGSWGG